MKKAVKKNRSVSYAEKRARQEKHFRQEVEMAVRTQMVLACAALNDSEGFGLVRITRFADANSKWTLAWKDDPERTLAAAQKRLSNLGFAVDGLDIIAFTDKDGNVIKKQEIAEIPSATTTRQCADGLEAILKALDGLHQVVDAEAVKNAMCYVNQAIDELQELMDDD